MVPELLAKAAAGLVGALASAASVVAVGGAVSWSRFSAAGLPADQAVAALAREELLVTGARTIVVSLLVALAIVVIAYVADPNGCSGKATRVVLAAAGAAGVLYAALATEIPVLGVIALLGLAAALGVLVLGVAKRTGDRFLWFGCSLFVTVLVFASVLSTLANYSAPKVQAAVILRGPQDRGLSGLYVARNEQRVYIGRPGERALYVYPCKDITALAIGPPQPPEVAAEEANPLRTELLEARSRARGLDIPTADQEPQEEAAAEATKAGAPPSSSPIC